ncbi:tetratricopeptide repeat protein, partial [Klebsiella pneumoniae]|uniref:tetratricopeptide repeat protein n=1 Tax=Klebsiella pneumoniae TaxID=573 RepID=UPI0019083530
LFFTASGLLAQSTADGMQHLYYQRYHSAAATFQEMTASEPKDDQAWYGLAKAYLQQGETDKAKLALQAAPDKVYDEPWYQAAKGEMLLNS